MAEQPNPQNNTPTPAPVTGWAKLFTAEGLPQLFQIVLGLSSLFYVAGYLSWAYYAWQNGLGFLTPLREQYFIAGVVPVFLIILIILFLNQHFIFSKHLTNWWKSMERKRGIRIYALTIVIYILFLIGMVILLRLDDEGEHFIMLSFLLFLWLTPTYFLTHNNNTAAIRTFAWPFMSLIMLVLSFKIYAVSIFPILPREFGGPEGTFVKLDLKREEISPQTLAFVSDSATRLDTSKVFRTNLVYLIFDGGDMVLLEHIDSPYIKFKLKRESIQAVFPEK
jgi:ABC-type multidrug transport system fused ATPase/permease subunit